MLILYMGQYYTEPPKLEAVESEEIVGLYLLRIAEDGTPRTVILLRGGIERVACLSVEDIAKATEKQTKYIRVTMGVTDSYVCPTCGSVLRGKSNAERK